MLQVVPAGVCNLRARRWGRGRQKSQNGGAAAAFKRPGRALLAVTVAGA